MNRTGILLALVFGAMVCAAVVSALSARSAGQTVAARSDQLAALSARVAALERAGSAGLVVASHPAARGHVDGRIASLERELTERQQRLDFLAKETDALRTRLAAMNEPGSGADAGQLLALQATVGRLASDVRTLQSSLVVDRTMVHALTGNLGDTHVRLAALSDRVNVLAHSLSSRSVAREHALRARTKLTLPQP